MMETNLQLLLNCLARRVMSGARCVKHLASGFLHMSDVRRLENGVYWSSHASMMIDDTMTISRPV